MQIIIDTFKNTGKLHHAYCIEGERNDIKDNLTAFVEQMLGFPIQGNPDFYMQEFETFGIDDGRAIKDIHANRPFGNRKIFVIATNFITREAQNSLLKIFEEPGEGNHFFLIMPSAEILLPTLTSRMQIVDARYPSKKHIQAETFLKSTRGVRLEIIKGLVDEIADEKKSRIDAVTFLNTIEATYRTLKDPFMFTKNDVDALEEIISCKSYVTDRSSSIKMILEHIALVTPQI